MKRKAPAILWYLTFLTAFVIFPITAAGNTTDPGPTPIPSSLKVAQTEKEHCLTLITGDRIFVTKDADNRWQMVIDPNDLSSKGKTFFSRRTQTGDDLIIPEDVTHLVPDKLDALFFNINYLMDNKLDDDHLPFIPAIVAYQAGATLQDQSLRALGGKTITLSSIQSSAVSMEKSQLRKRSASLFSFANGKRTLSNPQIKKIHMDRLFYIQMAESRKVTGADIAHKDLGLTGDRINIAILDSGVDSNHPDFLFKNGDSKIVAHEDLTCTTSSNPFVCDGTPEDLNGHGTHVASIALGTGAASRGQYKGIAPMAQLLNLKIVNKNGFGLESHIVKGIEMAAFGTNTIRGDEPDIEADVIALSNSTNRKIDKDSPIINAIKLMVQTHQIPVIVPSGNLGYSSFTVESPGHSEDAITVGATQKRAPFAVEPYSGKGPVAWNFQLKPDLVAPGFSVKAACSTQVPFSNCDVNDPYTTRSGTSMATAMAAGSVALIIENAYRMGVELQVDDIKNLLYSQAKTLYTRKKIVDAYQQGAGLLRVDRSLTPSILFNPAKISMGSINAKTTSFQKKIRVSNTSDVPKNISLVKKLLSVATATHSPDGGSLFNDAISVTPETLSLAPGEFADVDLTIDMTKLAPPKTWQAYSGWIMAKEGTTQLSQLTFGFTHQTEVQTLSIKGLLSCGGVAAGQWILINDAKSEKGFTNNAFGHSLDKNGELTLSVPHGTYFIVMPHQSYNSNGKLDFYRISVFDVKVGNSQVSVTLDARKAKPSELSIPFDPKATEILQRGSDLYFQRQDGSNELIRFFRLGYDMGSVLVHSTGKPSVGKTFVVNRWLKSHAPMEKSEMIYNVLDLRKKDMPFMKTLTPHDLNRMGHSVSTYQADISYYANFGSYSRPAHPSFANYPDMTGFFPVIIPKVRYEYYTPNIAVYKRLFWPGGSSIFQFKNKNRTKINGQWIEGKRWCSGETIIENWVQRPANPSLTSVKQKKGSLTLEGAALIDPDGHIGTMAGSDVKFSLTASVDGLEVLTKDKFLKPINLRIPNTASKIDIKMSANTNDAWADPSYLIRSHISFETDPLYVGPLIVPSTRYHAKGIESNNRVVSDGLLIFDIDLTSSFCGMSLFETASVQLSKDNGRTWFAPDSDMLIHNTVSVMSDIAPMATDSQPVSVKLNARMKNGTTIEEVIIRAFILEKPVLPLLSK